MLNLIVPSVAAIYAAWLNDALISADIRQATPANCAPRCHEDTHNPSIAPETPGILTENTETRQAKTPASSTSERDISPPSGNAVNQVKGNCLQPTYINSSTYTISDANPATTGMTTSIFSNWMLRSQTADAELTPIADTAATDSHKDHCPHTQSRQTHSLHQGDCPANAAAIGLFTSGALGSVRNFHFGTNCVLPAAFPSGFSTYAPAYAEKSVWKIHQQDAICTRKRNYEQTLTRPDGETTNRPRKYFTNQLGDYAQSIPPYIALAASRGMVTKNCNQLVNHVIRRGTLGASETSPRRLTLSPPPDTGAPASAPEEETAHSSPHQSRYRDEMETSGPLI